MQRLLATVFVVGLTVTVPAPAQAEHLTLYAAAGVKAPVEQLARDFTEATGNTLRLVFDTAGAAERRFLADPDATFLVTTLVRIEAAQRGGQLGAGISASVGDTVGGFAIAPGLPKPDLSTSATLRAALLAAPSIAFSDPARGATVGAHFMQVIETLGIRAQVLEKATLALDGVQTMALVRQGRVALGVTQVSEIMQSDPTLLAGPFPAQFDLATRYTLWYRRDATPSAAAFARLLSSPAEHAKLAQYGLRAPGACGAGTGADFPC